MKDRLFIILKCIIMLVIVSAVFYLVDYKNKKSLLNSDTSKLVIYGDNIDQNYKPIVENDKIYLSVDTIKRFIDEEIFYDTSTSKIIITNEENVYKFKLGKNEASKNMENYNIQSSAKIINDTPYIDMELVKDIYNIKSEYNEETNTVSIDRKDVGDINLNYNNVQVYSDINTNSKVIDTLDIYNTVSVYSDSLSHSRWYKIKTDRGRIGYIDKSAVTINDDKSSDESEENNTENKENQEKLIMFWQYGNNVETLGEKINGVNVVMPTWYELSDNQANMEDEYSKEYYDKAKQNGYNIWPVITNGFGVEGLDCKEVTSEILNNEAKRETLINNILNLIKNNKFDGINIDFEEMKEEDKGIYTQFLRELYPMVKSIGAKLSVDLYFTNYIDRKGVAKACDYLILMGYDQRGNWSKEAGSIAEVKWVEENIESLIENSMVDPSKIILGIPLYTRLWIEDNGELSTKVYSIKDSQAFVNENKLTKTWDDSVGQNYVETTEYGVKYRLWIEDTDSISRRADSVINYNLGGIATWQKGYATDDVWNVLNEKIKK